MASVVYVLFSRQLSSCNIYAGSAIFMLLFAMIKSYTEEEIFSRCLPCIQGNRLSHPTDCKVSFFCGANRRWTISPCSGGTYFDSQSGVCEHIPPNGCPYDRGINKNKDLNISMVPQCQHLTFTSTTSVKPTNNPTQQPVISGATTITTTTTKNQNDDNDKSTSTSTILGGLLGVAIFILIIVVVGIFLYRRRQKLRRPRDFYHRRLPQTSSYRKGKEEVAAPPTGNAAYLTRPLVGNEDEDETYEIPKPSEEGVYAEVSDQTSKEYYSEPAVLMRPPMPLPLDSMSVQLVTKNEDNMSSPQCIVSYSEDVKTPDNYMHPDVKQTSSAGDNHVYSAAEHIYSKAGALDVEEPYDYCQPTSAHPTLSFRRDSGPNVESCPPESPPYYVDPTANELNKSSSSVHPIVTRSDSPPYYVDPIADPLPNSSQPVQLYHTLEALTETN